MQTAYYIAICDDGAPPYNRDKCVFAKRGTEPFENLAKGRVINANRDSCDYNCLKQWWTGDAQRISWMWFSCEAVSASDYSGGLIYHSCNNGNGLHMSSVKYNGHDECVWTSDDTIKPPSIWIQTKPFPIVAVFKPTTNEKLKTAVDKYCKSNVLCEGDAPINEWDVSEVTDMESIFSQSTNWNFNGDISTWNVAKVTNMKEMFRYASAFKGDISKWNVGEVTNMNGMFNGNAAFNGDISKWNVAKVTNMAVMFLYCYAFNADISKWDVGEVTDMNGMFIYARAFNRDLPEWDVSKVTNMYKLFSQAISFNGDISKWNVDKVTTMMWTFEGAAAFSRTLCGKWKTSTADKKEMFKGSKGKIGDCPGKYRVAT